MDPCNDIDNNYVNPSFPASSPFTSDKTYSLRGPDLEIFNWSSMSLTSFAIYGFGEAGCSDYRLGFYIDSVAVDSGVFELDNTNDYLNYR